MARAIIRNVYYSFDREFFQVGKAYKIKDYRKPPVIEETIALLSCISDDSMEFIECKGDTRTFKLKDLIWAMSIYRNLLMAKIWKFPMLKLVYLILMINKKIKSVISHTLDQSSSIILFIFFTIFLNCK